MPAPWPHWRWQLRVTHASHQGMFRPTRPPCQIFYISTIINSWFWQSQGEAGRLKYIFLTPEAATNIPCSFAPSMSARCHIKSPACCPWGIHTCITPPHLSNSIGNTEDHSDVKDQTAIQRTAVECYGRPFSPPFSLWKPIFLGRGWRHRPLQPWPLRSFGVLWKFHPTVGAPPRCRHRYVSPLLLTQRLAVGLGHPIWQRHRSLRPEEGIGVNGPLPGIVQGLTRCAPCFGSQFFSMWGRPILADTSVWLQAEDRIFIHFFFIHVRTLLCDKGDNRLSRFCRVVPWEFRHIRSGLEFQVFPGFSRATIIGGAIPQGRFFALPVENLPKILAQGCRLWRVLRSCLVWDPGRGSRLGFLCKGRCFFHQRCAAAARCCGSRASWSFRSFLLCAV